ncbi:MAG: exosortase/archaeosortase family protein [Ferruginibacter sp.]|nr:exosortase/archaeosortase family protein [Ferruginibacter sp.]
MFKIIANKKFLKFVFVFIAIYLFCYYGTLFITGLAVPGGYYSPFVKKYFDIAAWLRTSIIWGTKYVVSFFGTDTVRENEYVLRKVGGRGVRIVYACLGFAIMSFWVAYTVASSAKIKVKLYWLFFGLFLLWVINVVRISLVLASANKAWRFPFGLDHHTWFNIIAYLSIFIMIYFYEKNIKNNTLET